MVQENIQQTVDRVLDGIAEKRRAAMQTAGQTQDKGAGSPKKEFQEITLKFGKGCVGEEFQGRDGNRYREILVPNPDKNDHRPWQTFVVKSNHVHELTGGKGITFATGTPISNSMTELYTNMRYLQYGTLQKLGLGHFDSWASSFGETQTAIELAPEGYTFFRWKKYIPLNL